MPLWAQNTGILSPRETYQHALELFGQGHVFTDDELQSLETLQGKLADSGDTDLAADVAVLRLAALTHAVRDTAFSQADANLTADAQAIKDTDAKQRDYGNWKLTRDVGLYTFSLSTAATLLLAVAGTQEEALLKNGSLSDSSSKTQFNRNVEWATVGAAGTMVLSLVILLVGQANM